MTRKIKKVFGKMDKWRAKYGDPIAMWLSRMMGTWVFISALAAIICLIIQFYHLLMGQALDVFNLVISLYTLFVDLIILKSNNTLNATFFRIINRIWELEQKIMGSIRDLIKLVQQVTATQQQHTEALQENIKVNKQNHKLLTAILDEIINARNT